MAETINIKLLIDAAESAKTVAETRKALKDLKTAALQVEEGSEAFTAINRASGQLQDKIGDLRNTTNYFANDMRKLEGLTQIASGIAGGFAIAQGAVQLFGNENEQLTESLVKLNAVMAVLNGLQAVGNVLQKDSAASMFISNSLQSIAIALTTEEAREKSALAVKNGVATLSQKALNAAMTANPVGILITLITAAATALMFYSSKSEQATKEEKKRKAAQDASRKAFQDEANAIGKSSGELVGLIYQLKATNVNSRERLELIRQINADYNLTIQNLQDEVAFQAQLNAVTENYIEVQKIRYKLKLNQSYIDYQISKQHQAEVNLMRQQNELEEMMAARAKDRRNRGMAPETMRDIKIALEGQFEIVAKYQKELDASNTALEKLGKRRDYLVGQENELTDGGKKYEKQTKNNTKATKENTEALDLNAEAMDIVAEAQSFLTEERLNAEAEALEMMQDGLTKRLLLLEIDKKQSLFANEEKYKNEIKKIEEFFEKKKVNDKLSIENEKELNDKKAKLKTEQGIKEAEITTKFETEKTKIILEEEKKRAEAAKRAAKAILTQEEYTNFIMFLKKELGALDDLLGTSKVDEIFSELGENSQDAAKGLDLLTTAFIENADKLFQESQANGKFRKALEKYLELPKEAVDNTTMALVDAMKENKNLLTKAIDDYDALLFKGGLDDLTGKIFELSDDDATQYTLKLTSFYQDKYNIIKKFEDEINAEVGRTQSFAVFPEMGEIGLPELDAEKANKLEQQLQERYDKLKSIENQYYQDSLFALFQNFQDGQLTAVQFNREYEKLEKKHNDNLLDIDLVYGQASQVELKERTIRKNNERIALQRKLNQELLNLEQDLQDAIMELFERRMDAQNRAAQDRYDAEIARIDAEEQKYQDSLDNRSAAEQAQLDIERGFDEQRKNAADRLAIEQDAIRQRQFNAEKANDAITVAIQTAVAVAKTIAELGGIGAITPAGIALIAAIVAQGAVSEALILSKQYIPAFAEGGLVQGPGTGTSDSITAKVSNGEAIINAKSTKMFGPLLSAINQAGGGRAFPAFVDGGMIGVPPTQVSQSLDSFERLEKAIYSLQERPIETYVKQTVVTNAQDTARKIKRRTTFG